MKFSDQVSLVSEGYKRSLEKKLTYLEQNIASALDLVQIVKNEYMKKQYEQYAIDQVSMLSYIMEVIM